MSIVFLHVGQCGCQVGKSFWRQLSSLRGSPPLQQFYTRRQPNALFIDSEPRVLQRLKNIPERHKVCGGTTGCGNNWAAGWTGALQPTIHRNVQGDEGLFSKFTADSNSSQLPSTSIVSQTLSTLEKLINTLPDRLDAIVLFASLSGGTGSGVGSRLLYDIRRTYGFNLPIIVIAVAAFDEGEASVQNINALLSLAHFQNYADTLILFHNSQITRLLSKPLSTTSLSTKDINLYISTCLLQLFLPLRAQDNKKWIYFDPSQFIARMSPMKPLNIIELHTSAHQTTSKTKLITWQYITDHFLKSAIPHYDACNRPILSLNHYCITRGVDPLSTSELKHMKSTIKRYMKPCKNDSLLGPVYLSSTHKKSLPQIDRSITIASNHTGIIEFLNQILVKVYLMLEAKAYIHHYHRFGCSHERIQACFDRLQETILEYAEHYQINNT